MAFLIASDVLIQSERKKLDLDAWLRSHAQDEIRIAAITVAELFRSAHRAAPPLSTRRQRFLERTLEVIEVVPYTEKAAIEHARLWVAIESTGQRIGMHDLILAATALEAGATVVTFNARRFAAVPGLTVVEP
jgi:predicted nucleic acid-binding protein